MPASSVEQTNPPAALRIGVDVGGTFTDLVAFDPVSSQLSVVKLPSTPPEFHRAVIEAVEKVMAGGRPAHVVHGSTVATNALLQRSGEPAAFITTEGFRDMLLIGRQNRPNLYALKIERPPPLTGEQNWFTVRERISAAGEIVEPLAPAEIDALVRRIQGQGLRHVAVCLLFSFVNPVHEQALGRACEAAGLSVSLSSDILPEFREYERASTTLINASLRPTVQAYLQQLADGLPSEVLDLRIMHSAGGTLTVPEAQASAARLVLSGPAGGVNGAALVAAAAGVPDLITYDMGGTSTDVAAIVGSQPQWTTSGVIDGLPIGLPAFDIVTIGAGGGSIAYLDTGGALRVGPRSAGAVPGPACYNRGGTEPTVTDANVLLGRMLPDQFAGGTMRVEPELAERAVRALAGRIGKTTIETALGILKIAESNMGRAIRAVTSRRGLDPRRFALLSFGGAGGLHACALAESLEIPRVLVPPYAGVLSALGMVAAAPVADASKTVVHLGDALDDARLAAEFGYLSLRAAEQIPVEQTASVEAYADLRFRGQSYEVKVRVVRPQRPMIEAAFLEAYQSVYGQAPPGRAVEIVTLRLRRVGKSPRLRLPELPVSSHDTSREVQLIDPEGMLRAARATTRGDILRAGTLHGPALVIDPEATLFLPPFWTATARPDGTLILERKSSGSKAP